MAKVSIILGLLFIVCSINARFTSADPAREFPDPFPHGVDNLGVPMAVLSNGFPCRNPARLRNEKAAYEQGHLFLRQYLKLDPISAPCIMTGTILDIYITHRDVLTNPDKKMMRH